MKKANVINLIRHHVEKNENAFRNESRIIANEFDRNGDSQLALYIAALLDDASNFVPQNIETELKYLRKIELKTEALPLPHSISNDILGIINAIKNGSKVNKFLFQGLPGTGKTESVKQIARILKRTLFAVDFNLLIDSKLGETQKNIAELFGEINRLPVPEKALILFDEIDAIALDRVNNKDLREMGRATTAILKGFDELDDRVTIIATTNLFNYFDKALSRRFNFVVDFNRYSSQDLLDVAETILENQLKEQKNCTSNVRLFRKIVKEVKEIPMPADLRNIIKTAIAFSDTEKEFDYLKRIYIALTKDLKPDFKLLQEKGYTLREIEILTGTSKSQVARDLKVKRLDE